MPLGPTEAEIEPVEAPVSEMYTLREEFGQGGARAIPLGWTNVSSTIDTAPVDGVKRYTAGPRTGAVSV